MVADDPYEGCGVHPAATGPGDPMLNACAWHDHAYIMDSWAEQNLSRSQVDRHFLDQMLQIAGANRLLQARAYLYFSLARLFGAPFWEGKR